MNEYQASRAVPGTQLNIANSQDKVIDISNVNPMLRMNGVALNASSQNARVEVTVRILPERQGILQLACKHEGFGSLREDHGILGMMIERDRGPIHGDVEQSGLT